MKRWAFTILLFLLLGALVNVAVAWGCALWSVGAELYDVRCNRHLELEPWERERLADCAFLLGDDEEWHTGRLSAFGFHRREYYGIPESWWDAIMTPGIGAFTALWAETRAGWPALAFRSEEVYLYPEKGDEGGWGYEIEGGIRVLVTVDIGGPIEIPRVVPIRPIFIGFLINTLFYALILWLPLCGPFVLRRHIRLKRGRCPKCGYDLRGAPGRGCSECGWGRAGEHAAGGEAV